MWLFLRSKPKSLGPRVRKGDERGVSLGPRVRKGDERGVSLGPRVRKGDTVGELWGGRISDRHLYQLRQRKLRPSVVPAYAGTQWLFLRSKSKSLGPRVRKGDERGVSLGPRVRKGDTVGELWGGRISDRHLYQLRQRKLRPSVVPAQAGTLWLFPRSKPKSLGPRVRKGDTVDELWGGRISGRHLYRVRKA